VNLGDLPDLDGFLGTLFGLCHRGCTSFSSSLRYFGVARPRTSYTPLEEGLKRPQ
jgi:hypothetical protein